VETYIHFIRNGNAPGNQRPIKQQSDARVWMTAAFCGALALAIAVLAIFGTTERGLFLALRFTARLSFLLFLAAYAGGAAYTLFGQTFAFLARHQREFGLSFAAAQLVHVSLVLWLYGIATQKPIPDSSAVMFSIGIVCVYVLALYSVERVRKLLTPGIWRFVRFIGLNYIAYLFYADFTGPLFNGFKQPIAYLPFVILIVLGVALRFAAWTQSLLYRSGLLQAPKTENLR
jgi:hypothetical protein